MLAAPIQNCRRDPPSGWRAGRFVGLQFPKVVGGLVFLFDLVDLLGVSDFSDPGSLNAPRGFNDFDDLIDFFGLSDVIDLGSVNDPSHVKDPGDFDDLVDFFDVFDVSDFIVGFVEALWDPGDVACVNGLDL